MKLCDLTQFYSPVSGGVKRYLNEKILYLHQHTDADEHVLIVPGEKDCVTVEGRSRTYSIKSPLISKTSRYRALLRLEAIEEVLEKERPDLIESGDPYQVAWKAIASGDALRIPVIGFYHSHFPEAYLRSSEKYFGATATDFVMDLSKRYIRNLYNLFSCTLVPSPALGKLLGDWGVENLRSIDLGVNTDIFKPDKASNARSALHISDSAFLLLYVGRLAGEKNTRALFDAFNILTRQHPGRFHLLAVGDGAQRDALIHLKEQTGAVTWLPYCGNSMELAAMYSSADLFVHPGVQETFGLVTLESQACGTPVVGIRGSYMDRIIHSDQTHWAAENTPEALAAAILGASRLDLATIGTAVSRRVASLYSWQKVFANLFAIYRDVICNYRN